MMTYQEYIDFGGYDGVKADAFDTLLKSAKRQVDRLVGYNAADQHERGFLSDFAFEQYQNAVVAQIEYTHFVGAETIAGPEEMTDVSVGNFSYKAGSTGAGSQKYSNEVFDYLAGGGFLGGAVDVYEG